MKNHKPVQIQNTLHEDLEELARKLSFEQNRRLTVTTLIREALQEYLDKFPKFGSSSIGRLTEERTEELIKENINTLTEDQIKKLRSRYRY